MQSRYYDPELGRFINADAYASTDQGILGNNKFAYCLNNPVIFSDPHGSFALIAPAILPYDPNPRPSYISNQDDDSIGDQTYGLSTVSFSGCGAVATYNAMVSLGEDISFTEVLEYYNSNIFQLNFFGFAGTPIDAVAQYFVDKGYNVVITDDQTEMDIRSRSADACILWYMFPATYTALGISVDAFGAHFVEYSCSEGGYIGRNTAEGNGTYPFAYPSDYAYKGHRYYAVGIYIYKPEE